MAEFDKEVMPDENNLSATSDADANADAIPAIADSPLAEAAPVIEPPLQSDEFLPAGSDVSEGVLSDTYAHEDAQDAALAVAVAPHSDAISDNNIENILPVSAPIERDFEELTLAELLGQFWQAPRQTWHAFSNIIKPDDTFIQKPPVTVRIVETTTQKDDARKKDRPPLLLRLRVWATNPAAVKLTLYVVALCLAVIGTLTFSSDLTGRTEDIQLVAGAPFLILALLIWLFAEIFDQHQTIRTWWTDLDSGLRWRLFARLIAISIMLVGIGGLLDASDELVSDVDRILNMVAFGSLIIGIGVALWLVQDLLIALNGRHRKSKDNPTPEHALDAANELPWYTQIHPIRIFLVVISVFLSLITFFGSANNQMNVPGFWFASIAGWSLALAPLGWTPFKWLREQAQNIRTFRITSDNRWIFIALLAIIVLGATFRLSYLDEVPPQMTSDHVEKLLDSARVANGSRDIFFANNGGREPFQMYAMALFSQLPGQGINHHSLKLLAIIESLITLPILFWFGREVIGGDNRRLGTLVGLILAALVAASYWHTSVTRLALRIILTPLMTALLLIYLSRAIRHNQRADFIKAGLVLGFGLYMYQAVRMLPVVIVVAIAMVIYFGARNWQQRLKYAVNLAVLVLIAFVVFIPMFRYSLENPDQFWRRTAGRLLGDELITETLPDGRLVDRYATLEERLYAFNQNIPILLSNIRNALLMFNWKGDVAWINGFPNHPALDVLAGALFVVGLGAWLILMVKKRDVVHSLMPITLFIMLLPSALSIAYPVENPSLTRTSGALPVVFLLAAYPLALLVQAIMRFLDNQFGRWLAIMTAGLIILGSYAANASVYFTGFVASYHASSLPYTEAGQVLRGFAISDGAYGNAFMLAYNYWWDHRAVGLASGLETIWVNGVYDYIGTDTLVRDVDYVPHFIRDALNRTDIFRFNPDRDLLFFYSVDDLDAAQQLEAWFPQGNALRYVTQQWGDDFMLYRVPALGLDEVYQFLADNGL